MAEEHQCAAREADVAGGDCREAERGERSNDPRHEPVDGFLRSKGIRFLVARLPRARSVCVSANRVSRGKSSTRSQRPCDQYFGGGFGTAPAHPDTRRPRLHSTSVAAKERIAPVSRSCQGQPAPGPLQVSLHPSVHRYRSPVPAVRELLDLHRGGVPLRTAVCLSTTSSPLNNSPGAE